MADSILIDEREIDYSLTQAVGRGTWGEVSVALAMSGVFDDWNRMNMRSPLPDDVVDKRTVAGERACLGLCVDKSVANGESEEVQKLKRGKNESHNGG